jgi:hypothetical protein
MQLLYQEREACAIMCKQGAAPAPVACVVTDDAENCSECPVCMENMPGTAAFGCGHATCFECLRTMLEGGHSGCPICRKTMNPGELASTAADREKAVKGFHSVAEQVVFVMTLRTASCGLNLVHGKRVVFLDVPLNEQLQLQGESRVYRFGQNASVEVSYIYYSGSVEERVWKYRNMDTNPGANSVVAHTAQGATIIMTESNKRLQRQHQLAGLLITS